MNPYPYKTAVILAGGKSRRMGTDKLRLDFNGRTLLENAVLNLQPGFDKIFLSVADESLYPEIPCKKIPDIFPAQGPLAGLHAALSKTLSPAVFLAAADMPYTNYRAALRIIELSNGYDACIPLNHEGLYEPLFAYYNRSVLPVAESLLESGKNKMSGLFKLVHTRFVSHLELGLFYSDRLFLNINRMDDYGLLR